METINRRGQRLWGRRSRICLSKKTRTLVLPSLPLCWMAKTWICQTCRKVPGNSENDRLNCRAAFFLKDSRSKAPGEKSYPVVWPVVKGPNSSGVLHLEFWLAPPANDFRLCDKKCKVSLLIDSNELVSRIAVGIM